MQQFIIAATTAFASNLQKAGLSGPYTVRLIEDDGAAFERAAAGAIPITGDANGAMSATVGQVTFVWGNEVIDGGEF